MHPSNVKMFFKRIHIVALERSETQTVANFVAICGGLLGLFLGISALSIVEFIYFITLRLYLRLRQQSRNSVVPFKTRTIDSIFIDMPNHNGSDRISDKKGLNEKLTLKNY